MSAAVESTSVTGSADELITEGLVILDDVKVVKYVGRGQEPRP